MKKYFKWSCVICVVLILCFFYAHIDKMYAVYDLDVDPGDYVGTNLDTCEEYKQEFTSEEKALDGVALKFAMSGEELQKVKLIYSIESEDGETLREGELEGSKFKNQKFNKLGFDRIEDTKDKTFVFKCHVENNDINNGISIQQEGENLVLIYYMFKFDLETFVIACALCAYVIIFMQIVFKMFKE